MTYRATSPFDLRYLEAFREPFRPDSLIDAHARRYVSLDGPWKFHIDPYDSTRRRSAFAPGYLGLLSMPEEDALRIPFNDLPLGAWQTVNVPGCWNEERPDLANYEGVALYVKEFDAPAPGPCYYLHTARRTTRRPYGSTGHSWEGIWAASLPSASKSRLISSRGTSSP
jgi:hypothetical protein